MKVSLLLALAAIPLVAAPFLASAPALAAPPPCVPVSCVVQATIAGFAPPVALVPTNTPFGWLALDQPHTASEDATAVTSDPCFNVLFGASGAKFATFTIVDGTLYAERSGQMPRACDTASVAPDGAAAVVHYNCRYHPTMVGVLTVARAK